MLATTRRAVGLVGLTGSLVAYLQLPLGVAGPQRAPAPELVWSLDSFSLPANGRFGAAGDDTTVVPVMVAFERFTWGAPPAKQPRPVRPVTSAAALEQFKNPRTLAAFTEETATPHPLEVLAAEVTEATTPSQPFKFEHVTVKRKQTLEELAKAERLDVEVLERLNGKKRTDVLAPGLRVDIYRGACAAHAVKPGESVWSIARRYRANMAVIIYLNALRSPTIRPGVTLKVPRANVDEPTLASIKDVDWVRRLLEPGFSALVGDCGRLTSGFGWRRHPVTRQRAFHQGVDISAPAGTPIKAYKDGVVERCGDIGNLGTCVILRHPNGLVSFYGHCAKTLVKAGDRVTRGQVVARVGKTGRATGCHLHFALRKGSHFLNPLEFVGAS